MSGPLIVATLGLFLAWSCQSVKGLALEYEPDAPPELYNIHRGLQPGILYRYKYTGTVATWISEDSTQYSGSALRADLDLERTQDGSFRVKASNVEVAEANKRTRCDAQKDTDFSYQPMERNQAALLEQSFLVHIDETEVYMKVTSSEPLWITNLRRGFVYSLPLSILTGNSPTRLTFRLTEETMIGKCFNWYSQLKLSSYHAALENRKQEERIEEDVQRYATSESYTQGKGTGTKGRPKTKRPSKTSKTRSKTKTGTKTGGPGSPDPPSRLIRPINDTLWLVTRTLDDVVCKENHFVAAFRVNPETVERTQRSSQGTFLIRGEQGGVVRLERGEVKGDTVVYTGDCEDKYIRTSTKQVLELRAVRHGEVQVERAEEQERTTLSFQKVQPGPDGLNTDEGMLTGIGVSRPLIEYSKTKIKEYLTLLSAERPEDNPDYMGIFKSMVEHIYVLHEPEIEMLVSEVLDSPKSKRILFQAFVASGHRDAVRFLLQKMEDRSFFENNILVLFQLFQTATYTIRDPSIIPEMLNAVNKMELHGLFLGEAFKYTALLSTTKFARDSCIQQQSGEGRCDNTHCGDTRTFLDSILPFLSRGLKDPEKWKQLVHVQALCTLATPFIIPILEPIIQGKNNDDRDLRMSAIYCLTADNLPKTAHSMVLDILVPLLNNPTEFPEVRSIAFLTITSWEPTNLSWWEHVALSTWRENSTQVAAFISTALTSLSEGKDPRSMSAKKVVHLAKHPNEQEAFILAKSAYVYLEEVAENCRAGTNMNVAWLSSTESVFPRTVYLYLQTTSVMEIMQKLRAAFFSSSFPTLYLARGLKREVTPESEDSETFFSIFEELLEHLELSPISHTERDTFTLFYIFELIYQTIGGTQLPYEVYLFTSEFIPIHIRIADSSVAFASDLGLPIIVKYTEDMASSQSYEYTPDAGNKLVVKLDHQSSVNVKVAVPWGYCFAAGAGLEAETSVLLPLTFNFFPRSISFMLPALKTALMRVSGTMYTSLTPLFPFGVPDEVSKSLGKMAVLRGDVLEGSTKLQLLEKLGIHLVWEWMGDSQQPGDLMTVNKALSHQLHYHNFEYKLVFDPALYVSKVINLTIFTDVKKREGFTPATDDGQITQVSQGAADYEFMTQVSGSSDSEIFGQTSSGQTGFDYEETQSQTVTTHMQRVEDQITTLPGGTYTIGFAVEPDARLGKYELVISVDIVSQQRLGIKTPAHLHITFVNGSMEDIFSSKLWSCLDMKYEIPYLTPMPPKETLLQADLTESLAVSIYNTEYCEGSPALEIKARQEVSRTTLAYVQDEIEKEACDGSFPRRFLPLYDSVHVEVTGEQELISSVEALHSWTSLFLDLDVVDFIMERAEQPDKITADAKLDLKTRLWKISVAALDKKLLFSVPYDPTGMEIGGTVQGYMFDVLSEELDKVCYVRQDSVRTFDGLVHQFEPSSCWTSASIYATSDELSDVRYLQFAVQVRHIDDQWEVRLIWPYSGLMLDITRSETLVNEEPFSGQSDKFVLHRLQDSQLVEAGFVLIWVGDTVKIRVSDVYYGKVVGLCGNYDGEPSNDMKGPLGCLYTDPDLLTTAWSSPAYGCSRLGLRSKRAKLPEFRETCDTEVFQPTGITQHNVMENCTAWEYHTRTSLAGLQCHSRVPVPVCRPGCTPAITYNTNLRYDCLPHSDSSDQQQQLDFSDQCFKTVMPATIPSGCFLQ